MFWSKRKEEDAFNRGMGEAKRLIQERLAEEYEKGYKNGITEVNEYIKLLENEVAKLWKLRDREIYRLEILKSKAKSKRIRKKKDKQILFAVEKKLLELK